MANLLGTREIERETVDNLISDQKSRDDIHRNRRFILECPDCKKKFYRMILFLQHREAHTKNRKLLHSENKKTHRKRRLLSRLTNNAAFNYEKHTEKLNCNNDITNKEVVGTQHEKNVSLECETQPREEIKIEVKDEFDCSGYTLTPFMHYGVHIEKDVVEEDDKSEDEKRKRHQVKDNALRPFQCEICDRTFARKCRLTEHFRIHTGEKPFECKICFSRFKIKPALTKHTITRHPENNPYKGQTLECEVCQKKFLYKSEMFIHKRVHTWEKPFKCAVCRKGHWNKLDLVKHLKSHAGDKKGLTEDSEYPLFKCEICSKTFTGKAALKRHQTVHTDDRPFQCKSCSSRFKLEHALVRHSITQHPENHPHKGKQTFECEICSKTFTRKDDLKRHQRVHTNDRPFQCKICSLKFKTKPALVKHSYGQHPEDHPYKGKTFECDVCQEKFPYKTDFYRHKRIHTAEKPFNCAVCQKGYWYKLDLVQHLKSHTGDKKALIEDSEYPLFKCEICSKTFTRKKCLKSHQIVHTDDKPFQCKICSLKFKTKPGLVKHSYSQHPQDHPYQGKTFECDACQKKFPLKSMLLNHKRIHTGEKPFNCAVCQKGYWKKLDLVDHLKSHTGVKKDFIDDSEYSSFTCEICSKTFMQKGKFTVHLRSHSDVRLFQCKICCLRFKTKLVLVKHSITQHPENTPYKCKQTLECDACQKQFLYKSDFLNHKRIHTKEKPFNCPVCQKGYWKKPQLVQHLKSHTGNEKDFVDNSEYAPFACEVCNKTFMQKGDFKRHKTVHTDDRTFQCTICFLRFKTKPVLVKHSYKQHPENNPYDRKKDYRCDVCQKKFVYESDMVYHRKQHTGVTHLESHSGKEREKDENLVLERSSEENASLQCEASTKEEIKVEVKDEFECSEYTLQPFTYHGLHIENNGVEEYENKHECNDVHEERKHQVVDQVREDVTDSESRDHCYVEEKLEKHKFNEPYPEVVYIKEDTDSENYTS